MKCDDPKAFDRLPEWAQNCLLQMQDLLMRVLLMGIPIEQYKQMLNKLNYGRAKRDKKNHHLPAAREGGEKVADHDEKPVADNGSGGEEKENRDGGISDS